MKRYFYAILILLFALSATAGQIVKMPLTSDLVDKKGNLTAGELSRISGATYVDSSGVLQNSRGNRENIVTDPTDATTVNWTARAQTVAVAADTTYVLSVHTSGTTATVVADTASITHTDSDTEATYGSSDVFTCTAAGDVTLTVDADVPNVMLEALPSGNVIGSDLFDQQTTTSRTSGASTVVGTIYRIVTRATLDFTTVGSPNNTVGQYFIATAVDSLGAGDELAEITAPAKGIPYSANTDGQAWPALAGSELVTNGTMEIDANWSDYLTPTTNEQADIGGPGTYSRKFVADAANDGIQSDIFSSTTGKLYKVTAWIYPDNTTDVRLHWREGDGSGANYGSNVIETFSGLSQDSWNKITTYVYELSGGASASIRITGTGAGTWYVDDVSARPVQISWIPYGTNTIALDETEEALKVTYGSTDQGAKLLLADAADLSSNLTAGNWYQLSFQGKYANGAVDVEVAKSDDTELASATLTTSWADYKLNFKCTNAATDKIQFDNMAATEVAYIRNLSIHAIPPLALLEPSDFATGTIPAQPRFEADGLLIEGEAVNLLDYSEDFSQWTNSNTTDTLNIVGPDGETNSATTLAATDANGTLLYTSLGTATSTNYTFSIWMKRISGTGNVDMTDNNGSNWTTKTLTTSWQKFNVTRSQASPIVGIRIVASGDSIGIFGAQLEATPYPTSYIPTNGSPAWRTTEAGSSVGDTIGYRWTMGAPVMNAVKDGTIAGSLIATITPNHAQANGAGTEVNLISLDGTVDSILYYDYTNSMFESTDETSDVTNTEAIANGTSYTVAVRWEDAGDYFSVSEKHGVAWTLGSDGALDADGFAESGTLWLGYGNAYPFHIKDIYMYDKYLTDKQLLKWPHLGKNRLLIMGVK